MCSELGCGGCRNPGFRHVEVEGFRRLGVKGEGFGDLGFRDAGTWGSGA